MSYVIKTPNNQFFRGSVIRPDAKPANVYTDNLEEAYEFLSGVTALHFADELLCGECTIVEVVKGYMLQVGNLYVKQFTRNGVILCKYTDDAAKYNKACADDHVRDLQEENIPCEIKETILLIREVNEE